MMVLDTMGTEVQLAAGTSNPEQYAGPQNFTCHLRNANASTIIDAPVERRSTPTSTPTAHMPDTGHWFQINSPRRSDTTPLTSIHTQPDDER